MYMSESVQSLKINFMLKPFALSLTLTISVEIFGYIVQECLDHVHKALESRDILSVEIAWAQYLVCWSKSGPGFRDSGTNKSLKLEYSPYLDFGRRGQK